jgi:large subunit ribosomal protein L17
MITLGKRGDLHARRRALRVIREREVAAKVFDELAERYRNRPGGYTRVLKTRNRVGDAAAMSIVELVEPLEEKKPESGAKKKKASKKKAAAKKTTSKKTTSKKTATKKTAAKKTSRKKKSTGKSG